MLVESWAFLQCEGIQNSSLSLSGWGSSSESSRPLGERICLDPHMDLWANRPGLGLGCQAHMIDQRMCLLVSRSQNVNLQQSGIKLSEEDSLIKSHNQSHNLDSTWAARSESEISKTQEALLHQIDGGLLIDILDVHWSHWRGRRYLTE